MTKPDLIRRICLGLFLATMFSCRAFAELALGLEDAELEQRLTAEARSLSLESGTSRADVVAAAKGDYARLLAVLYEAGFFGSSVSITLAGREAAGLTTLEPPRTVWPVQIDVSPGRRFTFGQVQIGPLAPGQAVPDTVRTGQPAGTRQIRKAAENAIDDWRAASHATAQVADQRIVANHARTQLDVALRILPGPPLRFGQLVTPVGSGVREDRIRVIAGLPSGTPFQPEELVRTRKRLIDTGAFSSVVLTEAEEANGDGTLDINLELTDAPLRRVGFGAEVSTLDGVSLEAFWLHRNIFGGAERLRFDAEAEGIGGDTGGVDFALGASLSIPGYRRADDTLIFETDLVRLNEATFNATLFQSTVKRERQVNERFSISLGFGLRTSEASGVFGDLRYGHVLLLSEAEFDARDNVLSPNRGYYANLAVNPFIGVSDSETGVRLTSDLRVYRGIVPGTVLAGRLQIGSVVGTSLAETPPSFLFFSGGGGIVRGQDFQSLGVETPNGLSGGRSFLGVSTEVRQDLSDKLAVVGFVDYGFVSGESDFSNGRSHSGYGLGIRYKTGLGPIRVDLGVPLGGDTDGEVGLYIGLGEAF